MVYYDDSQKPYNVKKRHPESSKKLQVSLRIFFVVTVILVNVLLVIHNWNMKGEHVHGIKDLPHIWTQGLNEYFREDDSRRNALLICSQGLLDLLTILSFYRFVRYS